MRQINGIFNQFEYFCHLFIFLMLKKMTLFLGFSHFVKDKLSIGAKQLQSKGIQQGYNTEKSFCVGPLYKQNNRKQRKKISILKIEEDLND